MSSSTTDRAPEYLGAIKELVDHLILGTREKFDKIIKLGREYGLSNKEIRKDIQTAFKGKLDDSTIRKNLPEELKDVSKITHRNKGMRDFVPHENHSEVVIQNHNPEDTTEAEIEPIPGTDPHTFIPPDTGPFKIPEDALAAKSTTAEVLYKMPDELQRLIIEKERNIDELTKEVEITREQLHKNQAYVSQLVEDLSERANLLSTQKTQLEDTQKQYEQELDRNYILQNEIENLKKKPSKGVEVAIILVKHLSLLMVKRNRLSAEQLRNGDTELAKLELDAEGGTGKVIKVL